MSHTLVCMKRLTISDGYYLSFIMLLTVYSFFWDADIWQWHRCPVPSLTHTKGFVMPQTWHFAGFVQAVPSTSLVPPPGFRLVSHPPVNCLICLGSYWMALWLNILFRCIKWMFVLKPSMDLSSVYTASAQMSAGIGSRTPLPCLGFKR